LYVELSLLEASDHMLNHNSYFEGQVQSIGFERNGLRATIGVVAPGEYHFNTASAERMSVISGHLAVRLGSTADWQSVAAGTSFEVSANSGFDVRAVGGAAAYLCEFLGANP
jgi:purine/pyrimidine-nucleoside phosphorylase